MKKFMSVALAAVMAVSMAACGGTTSEGSTGGSTIKIGGLGPTTGAAATYGNAVKNGTAIAVEEINALGGLQFEMNFQDDEADAEKSVNGYNVLKDWGMQVLLGTTTTNCCLAVAPETEADNMFLLTPSASDPNVTKGANAFQVCFNDLSQGTGAADYIADNNLAEKIAIIYDSSDPYSFGVHQKFVEEAKNKNLNIVADEAFTSETKTDFSVQVQKAKSAGADLVFMPIYYAEANLIIQEINKQGYDPKIFGCDGLDGLLTIEGADLSLYEDIMLLTPFVADAPDERTQSFVKKYQEKYGEVPNQFAADAYDGVYIILEACKKAGVTADMSTSEICDLLKVAITEIEFDGLTGENMTWSADGYVSKVPRAMKIVNGAYTAM